MKPWAAVPETDASRFSGAVGLSRWFSRDVAGTASVGVLSVGTETHVGVGALATKTATVVPVFVGVRRYLGAPDTDSGPRVSGALEVGPVTGHQSSTSVGSSIVTGCAGIPMLVTGLI